MAELVTKLADSIQKTGVKTSYGEKIDMDGTTVVPVAVGYYGFGAGSGNQAGDGEETMSGSGGGGGAVSIPVGAYVARDGDVRFEPNVVAFLAVSVPFVWVVGKTLARIIRALKR